MEENTLATVLEQLYGLDSGTSDSLGLNNQADNLFTPGLKVTINDEGVITDIADENDSGDDSQTLNDIANDIDDVTFVDEDDDYVPSISEQLDALMESLGIDQNNAENLYGLDYDTAANLFGIDSSVDLTINDDIIFEGVDDNQSDQSDEDIIFEGVDDNDDGDSNDSTDGFLEALFGLGADQQESLGLDNVPNEDWTVLEAFITF